LPVNAGIQRTTFRDDYGPINAANLKRAHAALENGRSIVDGLTCSSVPLFSSRR
jgi:hypothetical protein